MEERDARSFSRGISLKTTDPRHNGESLDRSVSPGGEKIADKPILFHPLAPTSARPLGNFEVQFARRNLACPNSLEAMRRVPTRQGDTLAICLARR